MAAYSVSCQTEPCPLEELQIVNNVHKRRSSSTSSSFRFRKLVTDFKTSIRRKKSNDSNPENEKLFSEFEVMLIQNSWKHVGDDKVTFGRQVYKRIFECEPSLKYLFVHPTINDEDMDADPGFRRQASAIIHLIDQCIQNLGEIETMERHLMQLGQYHTKLRGFGFKPEHWNLFKMSIMLSVSFLCESDKHKQDRLHAWNKLITFIVDTMRSGFEQKIKNYFEKSAAANRFSL